MKNKKVIAKLRAELGKGAVGRLRRSGRVPGVVYGHGDVSRHVSVDLQDLDRLFSQVAIENTVLELELEGEGVVPALVRDVQRHPVRSDVLHVDFYRVHAGEKLSLAVPVHLTGSAPGVKEGGLVQQVLHELAIRCAPENIPEAIEVDVSSLDIGDSIHVEEVLLPDGIELETDLDRTVCSVVAPSLAAVEVEDEEPDVAAEEVEPELIRKRPEDDEGEPAAEDEAGRGSQE